MAKTKELVLRIDPTQPLIQAELCTAGGRRSVKYVTSSALAKCIEQHVRQKPQPTGLLPPDCLALTVLPDGWDVALLAPFDRCDVTYHKTQYPAFPLPRIALRFLLKEDGHASNFRLAVLEQGPVLPSTQLYICPFPNVNGFSLCVGSNSFTAYDTLWKTRGIVRRVLSLPFGDDYYKPERTRLRCSARELFEHMKDKTPDDYYRDVLIPSEKTLNDFLK